MTRRELLKLISAGVIGSTVDIDKLLWIPGRKKIFIPSARQVAFLEGIPYHADTSTVGTWMGIVRSEHPWAWKVEKTGGVITDELIKMINLLEVSKR